MNLFISNNFIDTVQNKVKAIQVIKQVSDDDEVIHSEVMNALAQKLGYDDTVDLTRDIENGEVVDAILQDGELYVSGEILQDIFDLLYPGDYTGVILSLAQAIDSLDEFANVTLRLNHNCLPMPEEAPANPFTEQTIEGETRVPQPTPFQIETPAAPVFQPEVAEVAEGLGSLTFNDRVIGVKHLPGKNGILFHIASLYYAVYGVEHDQNYLQQLVLELRESLAPEDLLLENGLYATAAALKVLHGRLSYLVEWKPMVVRVVGTFISRPTTNMKFDLLGDLEG